MAAAVLKENDSSDWAILNKQRLNVRVQSITYLAESILAFEFVDPEGAELVPFTAGAHIDVHLPSGLIRQYSLCNDPAETRRYVVAVLHEPDGRGGSAAMHQEVRTGSEVTISRPRNQFALREIKGTGRHILLAGGIGITPIMAMVIELSRRSAPFHLYYCTRSAVRTAFLPKITSLVDKGIATLVHDRGDPSNGLDIEGALADYADGDQLYYCGPGGFLDAVEAAAANWPAEAKHCERFTAPNTEAAPGDSSDQVGFNIQLSSTGETFRVEQDETIVDVLRAQGIEVDTSCEEGYCGTCMTRYLEGQPIHHDTVLDEEDREQYVMICCARAQFENDCVVLDI